MTTPMSAEIARSIATATAIPAAIIITTTLAAATITTMMLSSMMTLGAEPDASILLRPARKPTR